MHAVILRFASLFKSRMSGQVLDVGALDVNGALSSVLPITLRVDMREGKGVDQVCDVRDLLETFGPESFDHVCSADALEHMEDWRAAMTNMWGVLKPGGTLLLTLANPAKGRHAYPDDYWRMPMPMFLTMFGANELLGHFMGGPSMGAAVVKSAPLFLDFEPLKVP